MALPASLTLIPLHGRILHTDTNGTPATGTVKFTIGSPLRTNDHVICGPTTITATLDATGAFTVSLPATDDPDVTPQDWTYQVHVSTDAWRDSFHIAVPIATAGTLELADIAPAVSPSTLVTYVLLSTVGQPNGVASLGADGLVPTSQLPVGSGGSGVTIAGDLGGTNGSPQVIGTHLASPLPIAQGGTNAATASAARTALGLGGAAVLPVGTTAGTVAPGDDSRITGAAQKTANLSDLANAATARTNLGVPPATRLITAGTGLAGGGDLTADRTIAWPGLPMSVGGVAKGTEPTLNLIAGTGATISAADNPGSSRVDVTISAAGGGSAPAIVANYITSGDISPLPNTAGGWQVLTQVGGGNFEIAIPAAVGDRVEVAWDFLNQAANAASLDLGVIVGSTVVRYLSNGVFNAGGATPAVQGDVVFYPTVSSDFYGRTGKKYVTVASGDLDGGNLRIVLSVKSNGTGAVLASAANYPFWWALTNYSH